ncbi:MAG: phosphonoacetaldehyde hydrolase, partial [Rhodoferax sp.]|nr:phosphonoacetaldehyde hydrolase [Rhodoferax sp.]
MTVTTTPTTTATATVIKAVVFDWAGTIVDFGSLAPMGAFVRLFARHGIGISIAQARVPMGLPKLAHIEALGAMPEIAAQWQSVKGRSFTAADAAALLEEFVPMSAASALE